MRILCILILVESFTDSVYGQNDVRRPPSITRNPEKEIIFREFQSVTMECKAEGTTPITYVWKRDGKDLNLNHANIRSGSDGDITNSNATRHDDGFYQCFATNQYGTALSTVLRIQRAFLQDATNSEIVNMRVQEGHPFVIVAANRTSFPTPAYNWDVVTSNVDPSPRSYAFTPRVRNACNGDLYVAYATKADELDGHIYKSTVFNPHIDVRSGGSYTRVAVTQGSGLPPNFPPNITYFSKSQDVALVGGEIELKCFFSGKPLPEIAWSWPGINLPIGRYKIPTEHHKTLLKISNIEETDEGDYICTASNSMGKNQHTHNIRVEAVPTFKQTYDGPHDVNITEGDSVTFNCSSYAKPEATVVWLRNGQPIDVKQAPKRFVFSNDLKSLTIRDVCRNCNDRETQTDLMVIQCNASNVHGHAFAQGYLNVLLRTKVALHPTSPFVSLDLTTEKRYQFDCSATSDPSTPLSVQWYKVDERGTESVYTVLPYLLVDNGSLTIFTDQNCSTACEKHFGEYRCIADNKYTQDIATLIINGTIIIEPIAKALLLPGPFKWIVIGIAIGLFVLLLLLICCIVCYLNKGDEYDVDGKERKSGKIPEEEILSDDFQDYYPSEDVKRKGSGVSLGSTVIFKSMDNINEYDEDVSYGEDGSFVGKFA